VKQIGLDFPADSIGGQGEILKRELEAKSLGWYGPLVDLVVRSSRSVRSGKPVDKAALTAELVKLEGVVKK
jgi:hypothetical protein